MSTIKSSAEDLTLNADGSGNDVIIQSDGSTKAIVTAEGKVGIGTTSPQTIISLDENTDAIIGLNRETSGGNGGDLQVRAGAGKGSGNSGGDLYLCSGTGTSSAAVGKIQFGRSSGDDSTMPPDEIWTTIDSDGLKFNTDTAAANALDDYEEGQWTPTFDGNSISGQGGYKKVGKIVYVFCTISNQASSATFDTITGLPFSGNGFLRHGRDMGSSIDMNDHTFWVSGTSIQILRNSDSAGISMTIPTSTTRVDISGVYQAT